MPLRRLLHLLPQGGRLALARKTWGIFRACTSSKRSSSSASPTRPRRGRCSSRCSPNSEEFYQSLQLPYHVVAIVSGALTTTPRRPSTTSSVVPLPGRVQGARLVLQLHRLPVATLDVRWRASRSPATTKPTFCAHAQPGTLCATERALCCVVENWQTPDGLKIPPPLQPYMGGRDFLPYLRELPRTPPARRRSEPLRHTM